MTVTSQPADVKWLAMALARYTPLARVGGKKNAMNSRRGRCTLATLAGLTEDQAAARAQRRSGCDVSAPDEKPFSGH